MGTSRSQLERLLDPGNPNVLLDTVQKAASAVGKQLTIGLTDTRAAAQCHELAVPKLSQRPGTDARPVSHQPYRASTPR